MIVGICRRAGVLGFAAIIVIAGAAPSPPARAQLTATFNNGVETVNGATAAAALCRLAER
jgi:hypothetical protein